MLQETCAHENQKKYRQSKQILWEYNIFPVFVIDYMRINGSGANFLLLFILSSLYLLTNCTYFPFLDHRCFGALRLYCGLPPLCFYLRRFFRAGLRLYFNWSAYAEIRASSMAARLSTSILAASSDLDRISASILSVSNPSNHSVSALLLTISLDFASSSLAVLLCALTLMVTLWASILSLDLSYNLSILSLFPLDFDRGRRRRIPFFAFLMSPHYLHLFLPVISRFIINPPPSYHSQSTPPLPSLSLTSLSLSSCAPNMSYPPVPPARRNQGSLVPRSGRSGVFFLIRGSSSPLRSGGRYYDPLLSPST